MTGARRFTAICSATCGMAAALLLGTASVAQAAGYASNDSYDVADYYPADYYPADYYPAGG